MRPGLLEMPTTDSVRVFLLTSFALIAFAGNSVLCRLALGGEQIDAASFTWIRLLTGIAVLLFVLKVRHSGSIGQAKGSWRAAFCLFIYAAGFSYAYITLDTGTGALILFAAVQITMIAVSVWSGNKLLPVEWLGVGIAFTGFVYLMLPDVGAPPLAGFVLMTIAGVAWGFYTLAGKQSTHALDDTSWNFIRTLPLVVVLIILTVTHSQMSAVGIMLAMLSGGIASGIGYAIWYAALEGLSAVQAAVLQLLVPVIAALGGVVFSDEAMTVRFVISCVLILGGILMVIVGKYRIHNRRTE